MKDLRPVGSLLFFLALLGGLLLLHSLGVDDFSAQLASLSTGPGLYGLDPKEEEARLAAARYLPTAERVDALLDLILQGSPKASGQLELWLATSYTRGDLNERQCLRLDEIARRSPHPGLRSAAAGLLLTERRQPKPQQDLSAIDALPPERQTEAAWGLGLRALRGEVPARAAAWLARCSRPGRAPALRRVAWRALGAFGEQGLKLLLRRLDEQQGPEEDLAVVAQALLDLAASWPESREQAIPACIALLESQAGPGPSREAALSYLEGVSHRELGPKAAPWDQWWQDMRALQEKFGG